MWTDNSSINRNDVSVHNENTRLREILEKERYRRKVMRKGDTEKGREKGILEYKEI